MHLPPTHPPVLTPKTGVLLLNLGTPDATDYWSMRRYLSEFLSDRRVVDKHPLIWQPILQGIILSIRPTRSGRNYAKIWNRERNESPLKTYTRSQCEKLAARFTDSAPLVFAWGMRYGNPSTESAIDSLIKQGCTRILAFALYPQYSSATAASAYDAVFRALQKTVRQPALRTVPSYYDHPRYIETLTDHLAAQLRALPSAPDALLMSFHGLPKRYLTEKGDPYHCHCQKTARLVRERLNFPAEKFHVVFQSRFGPEQWLEPAADETVRSLAASGIKHLAITSPGFASDCIETLEELNIGLAEEFLHAGGPGSEKHFSYLPCLNDSDAHIAMLGELIQEELKGWL
jgi:ferrochelatase